MRIPVSRGFILESRHCSKLHDRGGPIESSAAHEANYLHCIKARSSALLQLIDILDTNSPAFEPGLAEQFLALHRGKGTIAIPGILTSSLSRKQHSWYMQHAGANLAVHTLYVPLIERRSRHGAYTVRPEAFLPLGCSRRDS